MPSCGHALGPDRHLVITPTKVCEHALGTRAALLREADAAQRGGAVARVMAESEDVRTDRL